MAENALSLLPTQLQETVSDAKKRKDSRYAADLSENCRELAQSGAENLQWHLWSKYIDLLLNGEMLRALLGEQADDFCSDFRVVHVDVFTRRLRTPHMRSLRIPTSGVSLTDSH